MNSAKHWRIAFVVPRYGEDVLGGAETLARGMAEQLIRTNLADVQVLSTCARNHLTWKNELPRGESLVNGVPVRRFPIAHDVRNLKRYEALHLRLIQKELIPLEEQYEWIDQGAHSPEMYAYLERHCNKFDFLIFVPYLFGSTYYGTTIDPARSILWPCLHDEIYAYLNPTREMFRACLGILFNTYP
jgi:hypothetical protein